MNDKAVERTKKAYIWDREEVIESDHCGLVVELELPKGRSKEKEPKKMGGRRMKEEDWPEYKRRVEERVERGGEIRGILLETAAELETPVARRRNREWWDEEVAEAVKQRKKEQRSQEENENPWE